MPMKYIKNQSVLRVDDPILNRALEQLDKELDKIARVFIDWTDATQDFKTSGTIEATTAKLTDLTDGYVPYHVNDATGLANSPIRISGTKVGIGVVPGNALHVAGNIQVNSTSQKIHSNIWEVVSSTAHMKFRISSGDAMIIQKTTRNVGIGCVPDGALMVFPLVDTHRLVYLDRNTNTLNYGTNILWQARDSALNKHTYASIAGVIKVNTNGAEEGNLIFKVADGSGSNAESVAAAMTIEADRDVVVAGCISDGTCEIMKNENALAIIDDILKTGSGKKNKYKHERMDMKKIYGKYPFMIHEQIDKDNKKKYFDKLGAKSDLIYVAIGQLNKKIEALEARFNN